jgi:quinol monooxygenase YgiN
MSYVLIVRMKAEEGNEGRAAQVMAELAEASRAEPGCEAYVPCRETEDARSFAIFERYRDVAAFEEHGQTEHFQRLAVGELFPLLESRDRVFFETV